MKFVSLEQSGGNRLEYTVPFDTEFMGDIEVEDDNNFSFVYEIGEFPSRFSAKISRTQFVITCTRENIFAWATMYIDEDSDLADSLLNGFGNGWSGIECEAIMSDEETKRLSLCLLRECSRALSRS